MEMEVSRSPARKGACVVYLIGYRVNTRGSTARGSSIGTSGTPSVFAAYDTNRRDAESNEGARFQRQRDRGVPRLPRRALCGRRIVRLRRAAVCGILGGPPRVASLLARPCDACDAYGAAIRARICVGGRAERVTHNRRSVNGKSRPWSAKSSLGLSMRATNETLQAKRTSPGWTRGTKVGGTVVHGVAPTPRPIDRRPTTRAA